MDTPRDVAARVRFAKYRGLRSWRSSEWDPKEGLPQEYGRVFAFQNPTRAQKRCAACSSPMLYNHATPPTKCDRRLPLVTTSCLGLAAVSVARIGTPVLV